MISENTIEIVPLFPSTLFSIKVEENMESLNSVKADYEFTVSTADGNSGSMETFNKTILDNFPKEKKIILDYFYQIKNNILHYNNVDFDITTSWGVKCPELSSCQLHSHKNSFYSGVFYMNDCDGSGELFFDNCNISPRDFYIPPEENNIYNSPCYSVFPEKNKLIFFPSYLMHRIRKNESYITRYSIAFNICPKGQFGFGDSTINIGLNKIN